MLRQNFGARLPTSLIREAWVKLAGNALEEDLNGWCAAFLMCQTEYRRLQKSDMWSGFARMSRFSKQFHEK
jgi:hypothetical protein